MSFISSFVDKFIKPAEAKPAVTPPRDLNTELAQETARNEDLKKQVSMDPVVADRRLLEESEQKIQSIRSEIAAQVPSQTPSESQPQIKATPGVANIENYQRPMASSPKPEGPTTTTPPALENAA